MKISYAITVCNEFKEIQRLLQFLLQNKRHQDEIVILYDEAHGDREIENFLRAQSVNGGFIWHKGKFENHFADWKNKLTDLCTGDYIFQIDADEIPSEYLIQNLPTLLEHNSSVELYAVPRVNTVDGVTDKHIQNWRWTVNENGWVNWPDFQTRIYKNLPEIKWKNKVHERLEGHKQFAYLPMEEEWALYHPKTIDRQERQNQYYDTL
jgi:hypothetical protein